jgi:hypothetical protein
MPSVVPGHEADVMLAQNYPPTPSTRPSVFSLHKYSPRILSVRPSALSEGIAMRPTKSSTSTRGGGGGISSR